MKITRIDTFLVEVPQKYPIAPYLATPFRIERGRQPPPESPGLGVEVNWPSAKVSTRRLVLKLGRA